MKKNIRLELLFVIVGLLLSVIRVIIWLANSHGDFQLRFISIEDLEFHLLTLFIFLITLYILRQLKQKIQNKEEQDQDKKSNNK